jgi:cytochrome c peroxidase
MKASRRLFAVGLSAAVLAAASWWAFGPRQPARWTAADLTVLESLTLRALPPLPPDPSNGVADNDDAARFGQLLFFDKRLSADGSVACASCHQPDRRFTDGLPRGRGIGLSRRNTRSIVGTAYSPWLYWDGRRDSQWAQALSPLEDPAEHGGNRMAYLHFIGGDPDYRRRYEQLFGPLPDIDDEKRFPRDAAPLDDPQLRAAWESMSRDDRHRVNAAFANIGKAIAAWERKILPGPSRFDEYVDWLRRGPPPQEVAPLSTEEVLGLQLFIGKARCTECHNGPLFTNHEFHNTGSLSAPGELPDRGRIDGVREVLADPFNCLGDYSDDPARNCPELTYVRRGIELLGATRTPSLRNLASTAPFAHKGQHDTLAGVLDQYNRAPLAMIGHNEAEFPLGLSRRELRWLEAFLAALDAPLDTPREWLVPPGAGATPRQDGVQR